jgi:hypothetical protein
MRLVAAQPVGRAELPDPGLDLVLQHLEPGELIHPAGQLLEEADDKRADRGVTLRGGDPGVAVDVIGDGYRNVLHSLTVTQFLWSGRRAPATAVTPVETTIVESAECLRDLRLLEERRVGR